jgi:hypothetical protein
MKKDKLKKAYIIHNTDNNILLCKVLNEYNSSQEADQDLIKLLTNKKTEEELLKEYSKKESF